MKCYEYNSRGLFDGIPVSWIPSIKYGQTKAVVLGNKKPPIHFRLHHQLEYGLVETDRHTLRLVATELVSVRDPNGEQTFLLGTDKGSKDALLYISSENPDRAYEDGHVILEDGAVLIKQGWKVNTAHPRQPRYEVALVQLRMEGIVGIGTRDAKPSIRLQYQDPEVGFWQL